MSEVDRVLMLNEDEARVVRVALSKLEGGDPVERAAIESVIEALDVDPMEGWSPDRWWQVVDPDEPNWRKALWCETSDEGEARQALKRRPGYRLQRFWRRELRMVLSDEENAKSMTAWKARQ